MNTYTKVLKNGKTVYVTDSEQLAKDCVSKVGGEIVPATEFEFAKWQDWATDLEITE